MLNTAFAFDPIMRFFKRDIDFSIHTIVNDNFFIDIFFDLQENSNKKEEGSYEDFF